MTLVDTTQHNVDSPRNQNTIIRTLTCDRTTLLIFAPSIYLHFYRSSLPSAIHIIPYHVRSRSILFFCCSTVLSCHILLFLVLSYLVSYLFLVISCSLLSYIILNSTSYYIIQQIGRAHV